MSSYGIGRPPVKGALITIGGSGAPTGVISFQYNPGTVTRQLEPRYFGDDDGGRVQATRYAAPSRQTITLEVDIDAIDQLEAGDPTASSLGIYPQLAALEMLLSPSLLALAGQVLLLAAGTIEIAPTPAPLTLFIWGPKRVVPVRVEGVRVEEQLFDPNLNPIHAVVTLTLRVLTYYELELTNPGYAASVAYQAGLEGLAALATAQSAANMLGSGT